MIDFGLREEAWVVIVMSTSTVGWAVVFRGQSVEETRRIVQAMSSIPKPTNLFAER